MKKIITIAMLLSSVTAFACPKCIIKSINKKIEQVDSRINFVDLRKASKEDLDYYHLGLIEGYMHSLIITIQNEEGHVVSDEPYSDPTMSR